MKEAMGQFCDVLQRLRGLDVTACKGLRVEFRCYDNTLLRNLARVVNTVVDRKIGGAVLGVCVDEASYYLHVSDDDSTPVLEYISKILGTVLDDDDLDVAKDESGSFHTVQDQSYTESLGLLDQESQHKYLEYLAFLRQKCFNIGQSRNYAMGLETHRLLEVWHCCDGCGEFLVPAHEFHRAIVESNTPDRAFEIIAEQQIDHD